MIRRQAHIYFVLLLGILVLFLLEAIREMRKYSQNGKWPALDPRIHTYDTFFFSLVFVLFFSLSVDGASEAHLQLELQHSMRLFRAQRNFYISGFSIFLTLVIRRLVILISAQAQLLAQSEASMRQAQSATTAARSLLSQQKTNDDKDEKAKDDGKSDALVRTREFCFGMVFHPEFAYWIFACAFKWDFFFFFTKSHKRDKYKMPPELFHFFQIFSTHFTTHLFCVWEFNTANDFILIKNDCC